MHGRSHWHLYSGAPALCLQIWFARGASLVGRPGVSGPGLDALQLPTTVTSNVNDASQWKPEQHVNPTSRGARAVPQSVPSGRQV